MNKSSIVVYYNTNHLVNRPMELGQGEVNFNRRSGILAMGQCLTKRLTKWLTVWLNLCNGPLVSQSTTQNKIA